MTYLLEMLALWSARPYTNPDHTTLSGTAGTRNLTLIRAVTPAESVQVCQLYRGAADRSVRISWHAYSKRVSGKRQRALGIPP